MTVVWDGRREGPGGPYLFAKHQPVRVLDVSVRPAARRSDAVAMRRRVLVALNRPQTMREIAAQLGETVERVNEALWLLKRWGSIQIVGERRRTDGRMSYGRTAENVYAAVTTS